MLIPCDTMTIRTARGPYEFLLVANIDSDVWRGMKTGDREAWKAARAVEIRERAEEQARKAMFRQQANPPRQDALFEDKFDMLSKSKKMSD